MLQRKRLCGDRNAAGEQCRSAPLRERDYCFWHDPEHADEAKEARRLGGIRRRREGIVQGTYDLNGLATVPDLRRLLEVAALDCLALENSIARVRAIAAVVQVGAKLLELGDFEERLAAIESVMEPRLRNIRRAG